MILVIAEKPSVAQSIAKVLGATSRKDGYMEGGNYIVSWCFGHLVELADASSYDERYAKWRYDDLPIVPENWMFEVTKDKAQQFKVLSALMKDKRVTELVCATDAGREGELIFRLVYDKAGSFYGLRRSEVLGLKWSAIDFQQNTITIQHTLTSCQIDGKLVEVAADTTKTKSSRRTLPLIPQFRDMLLQRWELQEEYKRVCGRCYNRKYLDYICVDEMGNIIKPDYLTDSFSKLLARHGLRHIRFHDLRHTCASLLLKNGVPMKQIQEWLGHSDFSTTANIYLHYPRMTLIYQKDSFQFSI